MARTPQEATAAFLDPTTRALRCLWPGHIYIRASKANPAFYNLVVNRDDPFDLRCESGEGLRLLVAIQFERRLVDRRRTARLREYIYAFSLPGQEKHPFLAYHWHPLTTPDIDYPHLHIEPGDGHRTPLTHRSHIPTGQISLDQVVRLAITQFGVRSLRDDWEATLDLAGSSIPGGS